MTSHNLGRASIDSSRKLAQRMRHELSFFRWDGRRDDTILYLIWIRWRTTHENLRMVDSLRLVPAMSKQALTRHGRRHVLALALSDEFLKPPGRRRLA